MLTTRTLVTIALLAALSACSSKSELSIAPSPAASLVPVASASPAPFGLPKASCGDQPSGSDDKWYGVFIDGGDVSVVREKYCGDAVSIDREKTGKRSIQVASFTNKDRAEAFAKAVGGEASDYDPNAATTKTLAPSASEDAASSTLQSTEPIGDRTTKDGYFAGITEADLDEATKYAVQKDVGALKSLVETGRVVLLKPGIKVHLEECAGFLCSAVRLRVIGTTTTFYTLADAVSK